MNPSKKPEEIQIYSVPRPFMPGNIYTKYNIIAFKDNILIKGVQWMICPQPMQGIPVI